MITIADYIGHTDSKGKPIGHPVKVVNEMVELLLPLTNVGVAVPKTHMEEIHYQEQIKTFKLPNNIFVFSNDKINNLRKKWQNLNSIFSIQSDIIWFINVDFSLLLYLFFHGFKKHKIWITLCYNPLRGVSGWRKKVIKYVLNKVDLTIITNSNFKTLIPGNTFFLPDYYYKSNLYGSYLKTKKIERMVCLGTMGETKQLEEFISVMNTTQIPVLIVGNFQQSIERFNNLRKFSNSNITIENKYVGNTEYYQLIASSRYVALPYNMNLYDERTSGILLESIFLNSVPVAPKKLLEYNSICGIGYLRLEDIPILLGNQKREDQIIKENEDLVEKVFSKEAIHNVIAKYIS